MSAPLWHALKLLIRVREQYADLRIPKLLACPAAVRWVSCEPLLAPLRLDDYLVERFDERYVSLLARTHVHTRPALDWIVVGGESSADARPCDVAWIAEIVRACRDAGPRRVGGRPPAVFVKQLGDHCRWNGETPPRREWPTPLDVLEDGNPLGYRVRLRKKKGNDMGEFPVGLRIREEVAR